MVGACLAVHWETWQAWGADAWMVQVLYFGYQVPFRSLPPLSHVLLPLPSYSPSSIRGLALTAAVSDLLAKEAIELAPPSPGFYSRLFVTLKVTGGWRLVIDLSRLRLSCGDHPNRSSIPSGRGLVGVPGSPGCLPSGSGSSIFSPVPQVLRGGVGLPVLLSLFWPLDGSSGLYPCHGPCLRDHASSWLPDPPVPQRLAGPGFHLPGECSGEGFSSLALPEFWDSCQSPQELFDSHADSGLSRDYDSAIPLRVFPTLKRIQKLSLLLQDFLSTRSHSVSVWGQLLGIMSSMSALLPVSRLQMRELQIRLSVAGRL